MTHIPTALRKQVRQRAAERCEYCRKPENVSAFSHQIDHLVASKHDGPTTLDNLAWACFRCNNAKGSDIAAYDEMTETLTPF